MTNEEYANHLHYVALIERYGVKAQVSKAVEEFKELITELEKPVPDFKHITEEMADAECMLEQLKIIFSNATDVLEEKARKIKRTQERLLK